MKLPAAIALLAVAALVSGGRLPEARAADGEPPVFTRHPLPTAIPFGHTAVLAADTEFEASLRWEWRRNGAVIPGATTSRLTLFNAGAEDTAEYHAVALSDSGARWSHAAAVIVLPPETAPGRIDETFADPGFDGPVAALARRSDGSIIAAGEFFSARGIPNTTRLARLLPDGLPDISFRPGAMGPDGPVYVLANLGDSIWAGGGFQNFDTLPADCLIKLTPEGARDTTFVPDLPVGTQDIRVLVPLPDGRLYVGGRSLTGSTASDWLVRLSADGHRDATFTSPAFLNGRLRAVALRPDGRLWLGGNFFRPPGSTTTYNRIALIEPNGSPAATFLPPAGANSGANLEVRCLQLLSDGSVAAGGIFSRVNNLTRYGLARILPDGSVDPAFLPPVLDDAVSCLALDDQNRLYAGGDFSLAGTTPIRSLMRLGTDGVPDPAWLPPMANGPVQALLPSPTGLLTGGSYSLPRLACARISLEPRSLPPSNPVVGLPLSEPPRLFRRTQVLTTFTGPLTVPDNSSSAFPVTVTAPGTIDEIRVWIDLHHHDVQTLTLTLAPPAPTGLPALTLTDGSQLRHGTGFRRTLFSPQSQRPLTQAGPPYTDALRPIADLTTLTGQTAAGTWTLRVADTRPDGQTATLLSWTLEIFTAAAAPNYNVWLANRPSTDETFTSYAFGGTYDQLPATAFQAAPFRLTHRAWPSDPPSTFTYWMTTDLQYWQAVTPTTLRKIITPSSVIIQATFPNPATPHAWWTAHAWRDSE